MRLGRLIPLLMLLVAFLGWESYQAWIEPPVSDLPGSRVPPPPSAGDNASEQSMAAELAAAVAQITAHPLLRPDRQPFKEIPFVAAVPQRSYDVELARFTVIGVLPIDGIEKALVVRKGGGSGSERWELAAGDPLPGFSVKAIRQDGVLLAADGKEFLLPLYAGGPKQGAGGLRTEVSSPSAAASPAAMPQGPAGAAGFPKGVLPGVLPAVPVPQGLPGGMAAPPASADPNTYRGRSRRPPVMPSRPQIVNPAR